MIFGCSLRGTMSMRMSTLVLVGGLAVSMAVVSAQNPPGARGAVDEALVARAKAIHEKAITLDSHVDIGSNYATPAVDPGKDIPTLKCDLVKMERGGLKGVFLAVFVGQRPELNEAGYKQAQAAAMTKFDALSRLTRTMYPGRAELATSPDDVLRIAKSGKRVILTGVENGYPIGEDLGMVKRYYDLGARYITLAHSGHNQIADSASPDKPMHNGLSPFGRTVVAEMNRLGIMVDVSHISPKAFWDVIAASKAPIIASHSGCRALCDVSRNLDDDQLTALAKNGGVIQVVALGGYLKQDVPERRQAIQQLRQDPAMVGLRGQPPAGLTPEQLADFEKRRALFAERMKAIDARYPPATITEFVDHIDHAVKVAGIDHVGVGTDFDGGGGVPGFNDHGDSFNVTLELVRRGYSQQDIEKIWGGNLLRVWRQVDAVAARSK